MRLRQVIVTGTPQVVAQCEKSYTGQYLKAIFEKKKYAYKALI